MRTDQGLILVCVLWMMSSWCDGAKPQDTVIKVGLLFASDEHERGDGNTTSAVEKFAYETSAAAVTMAISKIKNEEMLPHIRFEPVFAFSNCDESIAAGLAYRMIKEEGVDVIIGPPCDSPAVIVGTIAGHYNTPMISWSATVHELEDTFRFPTTVQVIGSTNRLALATQYYLQHFNWLRVALYFTDDQRGRECHRLAARLTQILAKSNVVLIYSIGVANARPSEKENDAFLHDLPSVSRVAIVCLDEGIVDFMMRAKEVLDENSKKGKGKTNEYVFLLPLYLRNEVESEPWRYAGFDNQQMKAAREAFSLAFFIDMKLATGEQVQYFRRTIPMKMGEAPFFYHSTDVTAGGSLYSPFLHDSMYLYAKALNTTIHKAENYRDGTVLVKNAMDMSFSGISGRVILDQTATRQPEFVLRGLDRDQELMEMIMAKMYKPRNKIIDELVGKSEMFALRGGYVPTGNPECGWKGELCNTGAKDAMLTLVALIVGGTLFVTLMLFGMTYFIRRKIKKSEMAHLEWKMSIREIAQLKKMGGSRSSGLSGKSNQTLNEDVQEAIQKGCDETGYYKGMVVWMKTHKCNVIVAGKEAYEHMRAMKAITAENVNYFVGLCLDSRQPTSVWLYCPKNSLLDVLSNDQIKLDWFFKFSFMRDLAAGMDAIHLSPIKTHGRLKSSNCLIDNRWVLRVTDFGMHMLNEGRVVEMKDRVYLAPEILRNSNPPLNGTQKADVYAFALIISEIITRDRPFATNMLTPDEVVGAVRRGEDPPFRPDVNDFLTKEVDMRIVKMMQDCWVEASGMRLSFKDIKSLMRTIGKGQSSNLMDHALRMMESYAKTLETQVGHRTQELATAYQRSDNLLACMMPKMIAEKIKNGIRVEPEDFDCVTVFFSDVHQFATIIARSDAIQIISLLNQLYTLLDGIIDEYDVYKVETINDSYMVVSGLPHRNGDAHASQIADMSLHFQIAIGSFFIPHLPGEKLQLRIGMNTGPVTAGVVGLTMPRYCLFGDTVNVASRIETNSKASCIHMSETANNHLVNVIGGYITKPRGEIIIKGKGVMFTYWLLGKTSGGMSDAHEAAEQELMVAPTTGTDPE